MNKKFVKYFAIYLFIFLIIFAGPISTVISELQLNPFDYARITDVEYQAVVYDEPEGEGSVIVREVLTFDVHAASRDNLFWELWRDLPEDYVDGVKVDYEVLSVKQLLPNGQEIVYDESPRLYWEDEDYLSSSFYYGPGKWYHSDGPYNEGARQYECVFFYVDGLYREEVTFEVIYEMHNAALRYNDCSDLYLALYSETTINHLESFKADILFPDKDMPAPGNYEVYTYGTNSNDFPITESADKYPGYYTFSFELDEKDLKFRPYNEYIEFDLVAFNEDKHIFAEYAPDNYYSSDDVLGEIREEQQAYADAPNVFRTVKLVTLGLMSAGAVFILLYAFRTDARMKKKHYFYEPVNKPEYYRDIPGDLDPNFAAALVFCKQKAPEDDSGIYSAILLSLARKKYITLEDFGSTDVMITLKNPPKRQAPDYSLFRQEPEADRPMFGSGPIGYYAAIQNAANPNTTSDSRTGTTNTTISAGLETTQNAAGSATQSSQTVGMDEITQTTASATTEAAPEPPVEQLEPLTTCEEYYYNLLVRHTTKNRIAMSYFQERITSDYINTEAFAKNIEHSVVNIGIKDGYFQKADYTQPKKEIKSASTWLLIIGILLATLVNIIAYQTRMDLAFGAFFILGICCIIASLYLRTQADKYILLTQFGEDEYAKWRGLYNFLNSETLINERTLVELPIWEKYLVYATAFGISEKVIKAISIRCPEVTPSASPVLSNNYYRSGRYRRSGRSFRSAVRSGTRTARSGGSFGGGGFGYGGGGRGGGGGGGGH